MLEQITPAAILFSIFFWVVLRTVNYYLFLCMARLYQEVGKNFWAVEGAYEIPARFQKDIFRNSRVLMFTLQGALFSVYLAIFPAVAGGIALQSNSPEFFALIMGFLILRTFVLLFLFLQDFVLFTVLKIPDAVSGKIEFSPKYFVRQMTSRAFGFAAMFVTIAVFSGSWFTLGGAGACIFLAVQTWVKSRKKIRQGKTR